MDTGFPLGHSGQTESKFPHFHDADTKIVITGSRQYLLHSSVLKNSSPKFRELLCEKNTAKLSNKAKKKGVMITNMVRASTFRDAESGNFTVELEALPVSEEGKTPYKIPLDLENGTGVLPVFIAYDKVLGAFYHHPINFTEYGGKKLKHILPNAVQVLTVAEYLGCVPIITQHFEATLLAMGQDLYRSIAGDPATWVILAVRMRSKPIYRESMVHAAGRFNTAELQHALPDMDGFTEKLLTDMATDIRQLVKHRVSLMASYYPTGLQRVKKTSLVDKEENSRNSYSNDILHWMALTIFRQWLGHQLCDDFTHHAHDMGHDFMKLIRRGGDAYLTQSDIDSWHTFFPMSTRASNVIKDNLEDIKEYVKHWTKGFFANRTKLDVDKYGLDYFTCAKFQSEKYPWEVEEEGERGQGSEAEGDDEQSEEADDMQVDEFGGGKQSLFDFGGVNLLDGLPVARPSASRRPRSEDNDTEFEEELRQIDPAYRRTTQAAETGDSSVRRHRQ